MKRLIAILFLLGAVGSASAVDIITAIVTVTNNPVGLSSNITVNGSVRYWTNDVSSSPATLIQVTNNAFNASTNLFVHLGRYPQNVRHITYMSATNVVRILGTPAEALTVSVSGNWAAITYSTNTITSPTFAVRVPYSVEAATNQTNIGAMLLAYINDRATNSFATNATAITNLVSIGPVPGTYQTIVGPKTWTGTNTFAEVQLTNTAIYNSRGLIGIITLVTNGYWTNGVAENLTVTNLSSPGTGSASVKLGPNTIASGVSSVAIGDIVQASGAYSAAICNFAIASGPSDIAIGVNSGATNGSGVSIGATSSVYATNGVAIGRSAAVGAFHTNSVAIGANVSTTKTNQVLIGTSSHIVTVPGALEGTTTNLVLRGTNHLNGDWSEEPHTISTLADGNNVAVVPTNSWVRLTGTLTVTSAIVSFSASRNGRVIEVENATGKNIHIVHQSGLDATAANRIINPQYTDLILLTNGYARLRYDTSVSRWKLTNLYP